MRRLPILLLTLLAAGAAPQTPAPGPVRVIGVQGAGCIAGAVRLPLSAPGLRAVRLSHSSFWGHPATIAALLELGQRAHAAGLPDIYIGDISGPRGGPLAGGHFSHQMGLDADVYLDLSPHPPLTTDQREDIEPPGLVSPDGRGVVVERWSSQHITLLKLATALPGVDRVLVNPAIKRQLCTDVTGDRAWLRLIRPWYGHASHMHIHFRCPADQPQCVSGLPPPPPGDGCDASLQWWFDQLDLPPKPPAPPKPPPAPPTACKAILDAPG